MQNNLQSQCTLQSLFQPNKSKIIETDYVSYNTVCAQPFFGDHGLKLVWF